MDTPFAQPIQNNQTSTGFSFPVTSVVEPVVATQPIVTTTTVTTTPTPTPTPTSILVSVPVPEPVAVNVPQPIPQPLPPPLPFQPVPPVSQPVPPAPQPVQPLNTMSFTDQKPKSKTKEMVLVGLLLMLLAGAIFGFTKVRSLLSSAAEDGCSPVEIGEQDLTANSMVVIFKTAEACKMQVAYGVDEILGLQMSEQILATDHRIKLSPLMPSTPYKYQIRHDETKYEPTRGFLTLPVAVAPTKVPVVPTVAVPTKSLTPTVTPKVTQPAGVTPTSAVKYTLMDFQVHFGSVDPRFDTDKNGIVNTRDWQLYSK